MKTVKFLMIFLILKLTNVVSQPAVDKAKQILTEVSQKTKTYKSIYIEFNYIFEIASNKSKETKEGKLYVKGEKYRLELAKQIVIYDGSAIYTYITDANEVQINNPSTKDDAINPSNIFTIWEKGFRYKYIKDDVFNGTTVEVVDLNPVKGKSYYKVRLLIDKTKKQIMSVSVYEKNNNIYTYEVKKFVPNQNIEDSQFLFDKTKYPGVEVIDMR